jgi:hypothetical protein
MNAVTISKKIRMTYLETNKIPFLKSMRFKKKSRKKNGNIYNLIENTIGINDGKLSPYVNIELLKI